MLKQRVNGMFLGWRQGDACGIFCRTEVFPRWRGLGKRFDAIGNPLFRVIDLRKADLAFDQKQLCLAQQSLELLSEAGLQARQLT